MSYNPDTGLAYIPAMHLSVIYSDEGVDLETWQSSSFEGDTLGVSWTMDDDPDDQLSTLQAFDPVAGKVAWEVPLPGRVNGGTMTTAGNLVFQGRVTGDLVAYDATSGDILWTYNVGLGISAPPVSYAIDGKQYVSLLVGWGGGVAGLGENIEREHGWAYGVHTRRLVTFSLEGNLELPPSPPPTIVKPIPMPEFNIDPALAAQGDSEYGRCVICHGPGAISAGMAPDLRASQVIGASTAFEAIVRDGSLKPSGMPRYAHLTDVQLLALRNYIRQQAELE
jgi:quinohemoprotein ethanol dehydrogenase